MESEVWAYSLFSINNEIKVQINQFTYLIVVMYALSVWYVFFSTPQWLRDPWEHLHMHWGAIDINDF